MVEKELEMTVMVMGILTINEHEPRALAQYFDVTGPLLEKAGGKIVQRFDIDEVVVGKGSKMTTVLVEYPDRAAVDMVFQSPQYKAIEAVRDRAFSTYEISIVASETGAAADGTADVDQR